MGICLSVAPFGLLELGRSLTGEMTVHWALSALPNLIFAQGWIRLFSFEFLSADDGANDITVVGEFCDQRDGVPFDPFPFSVVPCLLYAVWE